MGVLDLTLRPLAKDLGISPRTLLYYFGSREFLLSAIIARFRSQQFENLTKQCESTSAAEFIRQSWYKLWQNPHQECRIDLLFQVWALALKQPAEHQDFLDHVISDWLVRIQALLEREGVPPVAAREKSTLVVAAMRGLLLDRLTSRDQVEKRTDAAVEMLAQWLLS